ncbi:hypothetical protein, partial [Akkermansia sp.]|uniref:hypothetical protein n=2 Tax=Akkermansia sp. TaxID=1872421 RepID=UPI003AF6E97B
SKTCTVFRIQNPYIGFHRLQEQKTMKKTLFLLMAGGAFSLAQAASVLVDVYRDGTGRPGMNQYTSNSSAELQLQETVLPIH